MNYYLIAGSIGLISGMASGLFGVGGGIVMVPAMILLMSVDAKTAIGTSLAVIIPTAIMGTYKHYDIGNVNWKVALALAPMAILGGFVGAWLTQPIHAEILKRAFGGLLIVVGLRLLFWK
jgi:uncharacterized protein